MRKLIFLTVAALLGLKSYAGTFTSQASSSWNLATTWSFSGDTDGIPDNDDDVTILAAHNVTNNVTNSRCRDLTVEGTLTGASTMVLYVLGNYVVNGTETGNGAIAFFGIGASISGSGTFGTNVRYTFGAASTMTILNGTTIIKTNNVSIANAVVTNLGTFSLANVPTSTGATWINGATGVLALRNSGFMAGRTFDASTPGNSVRINYSTGSIPATVSGYYDLRLQAVTSGVKTMQANLVVANDLTINALNTLATNNFDLFVGGDWVKNGTFTASSGHPVTFNGSTPQTLSGTGSVVFTELVINNPAGVTINNGTYSVTEVMTVTNGTFNTFGNSFTLVSTATRTARIAEMPASGAIAGNVTVERFLSSRTQDPNGSHWSDLSSSVQNSTMADWDNELFFSYPHSPYVAPYSYSNVVYFDEGQQDYFGVSAATPLTPGMGFEIALTDDGTLSSFTPRTLTTTGVPNQGDQNLSSLISFDGIGENLVGNPFASSIAWTDVFNASSGILNTYDEYDANAGDYATFGLGTEIGSGQGFWVYTTTSTATLVVPETAKTTASNSDIRTMAPSQHMSLNIRGAHEPASHAHLLKLAAMPDASDGLDPADHPFRKSPLKSVPSITAKADGRNVKINTFNSGNQNYSMPLYTRTPVSGEYTIEVSGREIMSEYGCITLEDTKTDKWIDLNTAKVYSFSMNAGETEERFVLHFSKDGNCRSMNASASMISDLEGLVNIIPSPEGNNISFHMNEATPVTIEVTNLLGQNITDALSITAESQTISMALPDNFSGMYLIRISSEKSTFVKKYVRK